MTPTVWTRRLQILTGTCAIVFTIGTALQNFVIVNVDMMELTMRLAGQSPAEAEANAPSFLRGFRLVGSLYIVANALGTLAFWSRARWLFWVVIAVNVTQGAGVLGVIPPEVFEASLEMYGPVGLLPTIITDGGALILTIVLLGFFLRYRTPWAQRRETVPKSR